ncbi:MAG: DUF2330 domain-containing protein [Micrococcales bacterium]|nr:DUF2330 domain-containing protein [Micrococcales bacterium]
MTLPPLRRVLPSVLGVVLATTGLQALTLAVPAAACACGAAAPVVDDPDGAVSIGTEHAIVSADGGTEQIDMRLALDTLANDAGLVFPTPAPATVSLGDLDLFTAIKTQTEPRVVFVADSTGGGPRSGAQDGAAPPVVLDEVQLGPLHATTLAASDAQGLADWLDVNGYGLAPQVLDLLESYVQRDWYFVALQMTAEGSLDGELDPIRFRFDRPADGLVYPLALSQAAAVPQQVNLYVFDDHRADVAFVDRGPVDRSLGGTPLWAGPVDHPDLVGLGAYLTTYSLDFYDPATQVLGDLAFPRAANDDEVIPVVYRTRAQQPADLSQTEEGTPGSSSGTPLGWILLYVGLVTAVVTTVAVVVLRQRRALRSSGAPAPRS